MIRRFYWTTFWSNKSYLDVKLDCRLTMKMMTVMVNTQTMGQRRLLWRATRLHWMRKPVLWMSTWSSKLSYKVSIYMYNRVKCLYMYASNLLSFFYLPGFVVFQTCRPTILTGTTHWSVSWLRNKGRRWRKSSSWPSRGELQQVSVIVLVHS